MRILDRKGMANQFRWNTLLKKYSKLSIRKDEWGYKIFTARKTNIPATKILDMIKKNFIKKTTPKIEWFFQLITQKY